MAVTVVVIIDKYYFLIWLTFDINRLFFLVTVPLDVGCISLNWVTNLCDSILDFLFVGDSSSKLLSELSM